MTSISFQDCIRATPGRTLASLGLELGRRLGRAVGRGQAARTVTALNERTLADIGLSRTALVHEAESEAVARLVRF